MEKPPVTLPALIRTLVMDRDVTAGQVAGGGIAGAGLDVESIERAGIAVIGHINGEADLLVLPDFINAGEMHLAAGG